MNATQLIYSEGEQAALSIAGLVLCPLLSIPAYIVSRWRSEQPSKSLKSRAYLFYMVISGVLIGQFIGHKIEGKKPSFFEDLQFLLIGPLWLLSFIYQRLGVRY